MPSLSSNEQHFERNASAIFLKLSHPNQTFLNSTVLECDKRGTSNCFVQKGRAL